MKKYKAELESSLIKKGSKWITKLNQLHLTKEQVIELYNSITDNKFSRVIIFIGEKI